ncbi:MAG: hypothetical protein ABIO19_16005 [Burkholderiaceae bacterium]
MEEKILKSLLAHCGPQRFAEYVTIAYATALPQNLIRNGFSVCAHGVRYSKKNGII